MKYKKLGLSKSDLAFLGSTLTVIAGVTGFLLLSSLASFRSAVNETLYPQPQANAAIQKLKVSDNKRFLVYEDGTPFFWMGDTAWELFHRLNREEADLYLTNRASKGFTVIQAVVLAELDGLNTPNAYGNKIFVNNDPTTPNEAYFQHVDYIVNKAESLGLHIAMLPSWARWTNESNIFNTSTAEQYGRFLGNRYKDRKIIWVLGGDRDPSGNPISLWRAMAKGITIGVAGTEDYSKTLMTFHPVSGPSSSTWFHNDAWLDFNMFQTGHCYHSWGIYSKIVEDYNKTPTKPTLDGEPFYEDHPDFCRYDQNIYSNAYTIRKYLYWQVISGGFGVTYGAHPIWQMHDTNRGGGVSKVRNTWKTALNFEAGGQVQYLRRLIESRPMLSRIPDQSALASTPTQDVRVSRGSDGSYMIVHFPNDTHNVSIKMNMLSGQVRAWWYSPRDGKTYNASGQQVSGPFATYPNTGNVSFDPPGSVGEMDWVLVLDDTSRNFPAPGVPLSGPVPTVPNSTATPTLVPSPTSPAATNTPVPTNITPTPTIGNLTLVKAINMNGSTVTVDSVTYEAETSSGIQISTTAQRLNNQSIALNPTVPNASKATMIRSSIWGSNGALSAQLPLANGTYQVVLYSWEDTSTQTIGVQLEGQNVASNINTGGAGSWRALGPYTVTVNDGLLNIGFTGGDANFSGLEIWKTTQAGTRGDINNDGQVNVFDLGILIGHYGKTVSQYPSDASVANSDLNKNGTVDIFDLGILSGNYGT